MLLALGAASALLMFPLSVLLWRYLPELQFVQFPWRWLVPLDVVRMHFSSPRPSAGGAALDWVRGPGCRDRWRRHRDRARRLVGQRGHPGSVRRNRSGHGYEGTDEYAPLGCDRYSLPGAILDPDSPEIFTRQPPTPPVERFDPASDTVVSLGDGDAQISIGRWNAEAKDFRVESAAPVTLALRLVNYPAWRTRVDGAIAEATSQPETARMLLQVPAGRHDVDIRFRRTPDRTAGARSPARPRSCYSARRFSRAVCADWRPDTG